VKRFLILASALFFCGMLAGCGADSQEGLITDTIGLIDLAATEVGNIQSRVNDAVKKKEEGKTETLDLTDATKAAEKLKKTGEEAQTVKARIERARQSITPEQQKAYAEKNRADLSAVVKRLLDKDVELRKALDNAAKIDAPAVEALRKKIVEAQGQFESIARQ
jgi:3-methyladenine DNA glycosylase/8-oxoguanine DNA glycosylase